MKVLVVDDHAYNRELLSFILEDEGHDIVEAENGALACSIYARDPSIDLVLMDVNMPTMDGITATKEIKTSSQDRFTPVIFITALDDAEMVARCLEAGGDDFVPKPVIENVLLAKIKAHSRSQALYNRLRKANETLVYHKQIMDREHAMVEQVFANISYYVDTVSDNLRQYTSPMSLFNGDMVLSAPSPSGGIYFLIGDFTGHGLSAAVGSLPVSEIFFNMIDRQAGISLIASRINDRLHSLLPTNMFFCAVLGYLDRDGKSLSLWVGGMNDILRLSPGESKLGRIIASHMPLGVLSGAEFDDEVRMLELLPGERLIFYTDGVNEATNADGEEFGLERLEKIVSSGEANIVEAVKREVNAFLSGVEQSDDISIVELVAGSVVHRNRKNNEIVNVGENYFGAASFPWEFSMTMEDSDLKRVNAATQILDFLSTIQGIELHLDKIFTIVSELFSNSLEHGILQLDSSLKKHVDGFEAYYQAREERLEKLNGHYIKIKVKYFRGKPNRVQFEVKDSGTGFDYTECTEVSDENYGRGLHLLRHLCSDLEYSENGTKVCAIYELVHD